MIATDASPQQIHNAIQHPKISYKVSLAEESELENRAVDLITVANGVHWFRGNRFYEEADRVLKPEGILALWTCGESRVEKSIDSITRRLSSEILGDLWPKENRLVWDGYRDLHFPFQEIDSPGFRCVAHWNLEDLENYLLSWSSSQRYVDLNGENPVNAVRRELEEAWGKGNERKKVTWEICLRVGKKA